VLFKDMERWEGPPAQDQAPKPEPAHPEAPIPVPISNPIPVAVAPLTPLARLGRAWRRAPRPSAP
jgi:hypothetical protein